MGGAILGRDPQAGGIRGDGDAQIREEGPPEEDVRQPREREDALGFRGPVEHDQAAPHQTPAGQVGSKPIEKVRNERLLEVDLVAGREREPADLDGSGGSEDESLRSLGLQGEVVPKGNAGVVRQRQQVLLPERAPRRSGGIGPGAAGCRNVPRPPRLSEPVGRDGVGMGAVSEDECHVPVDRLQALLERLPAPFPRGKSAGSTSGTGPPEAWTAASPRGRRSSRRSSERTAGPDERPRPCPAPTGAPAGA